MGRLVGLVTKRNNLIAIIIAALLSIIGLSLLLDKNAFAVGENYTWESSDYIRMSGGNYADLLVRGANADPLPFRGSAPTLNSSRSLTITNNPGSGSSSATCSLFLSISLNDVLASPTNPNSRSIGSDPSQGILRVDGSRSGDHTNCRTTIENYLNVTPRDDGSVATDVGQMRLIRSLASWFGISESTCDYREGFPTRQPNGTECQREMRSSLSRSVRLLNPGAYLPDAANCFTTGTTNQECLGTYYREVQSGERELNLGEAGEPDEVAGEDASVCAGGGLGWITCPFVTLLAGAIEGIASVMDSLLFVEPLDLSTDSPMFTLWSIFRNIANVVFIIVFLLVIFSQVTSMGLSNYGIKTILPRLVIAAILVNISYFICAIAIDVFNILGSGIEGIMQAGINAVPDPQSNSELGIDWSRGWGNAISGLVALLIIGGAATGAVIAVLLGAQVIPIIISALLAVMLPILIAFAIIVIRHVFIIILVLLSPLAFVSMLLPGTNGFFNKWQSAFITVLLMYPIIMLALFGSMLAAKIILTVNYTTDWLAFVIALMTLAAGPVIIVATPKLAGALLSRFTGFMNNPSKGLIDRSKNAMNSLLADRRGEAASDYDPRAGNSLQRFRSALRSGRKPRFSKRERQKDLALTRGRGEQYDNEQMKAAQEELAQMGITRNRDSLKRVIGDSKSSNVLQSAAMNALAETGDADGLLKYLNGDDGTLRKKAAKAAVRSDSIRRSGTAITDQSQAYLDLIKNHPSMNEKTLWQGVDGEGNVKVNGNTVKDENGKAIESAYQKAQKKVQEKMGAEYLASQKPTQANLENIKGKAKNGTQDMVEAMRQGLSSSSPSTRNAMNDSFQKAAYSVATGGKVSDSAPITSEQVKNVSTEQNTALLGVAGSSVGGAIAKHYTSQAESMSAAQQDALYTASDRAMQNNPSSAEISGLHQELGRIISSRNPPPEKNTSSSDDWPTGGHL